LILLALASDCVQFIVNEALGGHQKPAIKGHLKTGLAHPINEISFRDAVTNNIDSLAMEKYRLRWPKVLAFLARQYEMSPTQFRRAAPWAERVWRNSAAEYRVNEAARRQFLRSSQKR
jgi:hypothetical protein